jgi:hypothetical protein
MCGLNHPPSIILQPQDFGSEPVGSAAPPAGVGEESRQGLPHTTSRGRMPCLGEIKKPGYPVQATRLSFRQKTRGFPSPPRDEFGLFTEVLE